MWGEGNRARNRQMGRIWFKPHCKEELSKQVKRILKKWQFTLQEYQKMTGDLGYTSGETANPGFFLYACSRIV
jgi:hypothetical protein